MSGATFHPGDPALVRDDPRLPIIALPYVGTVVTVRSELTQHPDVDGLDCYRIECFDGTPALVAPWLLQKLPPSDPAYLKFRDQFVREFALDAEPPVLEPRHPAIVSMLQLIGQDGAR